MKSSEKPNRTGIILYLRETIVTVFGMNSLSRTAVGKGANTHTLSWLQSGTEQCKLIQQLGKHQCVHTGLEVTSQRGPST